MSSITEAVIWLDCASRAVIDKVTEPLPFDEVRQQRFAPLDTEIAAGGSMWFTSPVYAAALNYVDVHLLQEWFRSLPWNEYDCATLLWNYEDTERGRVVIGDDYPG